MRVVTVYVGDKSQSNLDVGLAKGVWGFKRDRPEYDEIQPDDLLLLGTGFTGGSPRTSEEDWDEASLARIEICRLTSGRYLDTSKVWPDEGGDIAYPYRLTFDRVAQAGPTQLGPAGPLGGDVTRGLRWSAIVQGSGAVVSDASDFDDIGLIGEADPLSVERATRPEEHTASPADLLSAFEHELHQTGLSFPPHITVRFLCGLLVKPFVILAGLSGSGKTQLAMALGRWLGMERIHVAAVRPDWTGSEALFGYENLLLPTDDLGRAAWAVPPVLEFLLTATAHSDEPHLLVLDEMNLAHVERYFADALSGMESEAPVIPNLAKGDDGVWRVPMGQPGRLAWPANLLVVGTVNVDETTYQFSPKVLDRSTTLEFRTATESLAGTPPEPARITVASPALRQRLIDRFGDLPTEVSPVLGKEIQDLHRQLANHSREFGHRTYQEMLRYATLARAAANVDDTQILDHLVLQKVLPRLHGSARELGGVLAMLTELAIGDQDGEGQGQARLPLTTEKLARLQAELEATHFTAF